MGGLCESVSDTLWLQVTQVEDSLHVYARVLREWLQEVWTPELVWGLSLVSLVMVGGGIWGSLWVVRWLPEDYFLRPAPRLAQRLRRGGIGAWVQLLIRQVLGLALGLAGIAMLVLPGQGLLTILAALCVAEYPGKVALVRILIRQPALRRGLNALRRRAGQKPLRFPD